MLSFPEITRLIHRVLEQSLPGDDVRHVSIEARDDGMAEPAIFVALDVSDIAFGRLLPRRRDLASALLQALAEAGEERFIYLSITSPADREEAEREDAA